MVTETVVKEYLSNEMISSGEKLTRLLDKNKFPVSASLWFFLTDSNGWRIIIASPEVRTNGVRAAYKRVQQIISKSVSDGPRIQLKDITLVGPSDPLISLLKVALKTDKGISGTRFSKNMINGVLIEDAFIYRLT